MGYARKIQTLEATPVFAPVQTVAKAYNGAGQGYAAYADGDPRQLFKFSGLHAFADHEVWNRLDAELLRLKESGATSLSLLDAGCGPGTWLRRIVIRARELGFGSITARGFDIAQVQIQTARRNAQDLAHLPGVKLRFDCSDLLSPLAEATGSADITICLYSVLSHVAVRDLPKVLAELARVTWGTFFATVRAVGSEPTVFIDSIDKARDFHFDHEHNRCTVEFRNGSHIEFPARLFGGEELRKLMAEHFIVDELCGLDIFHSRFAPVHRWNPDSLMPGEHLAECLSALEAVHAHDPEFIDRANHLLLVGRPRRPE